MRQILFIFALLIFVSPSHSQVIDGVEIVRPRVIAGEWDPETKRFPVAIEFTIAPEWHMYWLNPGDAGSPPKVTWRIPSTWKPQGLQFPVPVKVDESDMMSYAYYNTLVLVEEIYSPVKPTIEPIQATIKWMVCKDICVPGEMKISGSYDKLKTAFDWPTLPLVPSLSESGMKLYGMQNDPKPGKEAVRSITISREGVSDYLQLDDFYPLLNSDVAIDVTLEPLMIILITRGPASLLQAVNGLVFIEGKAYWLDSH